MEVVAQDDFSGKLFLLPTMFVFFYQSFICVLMNQNGIFEIQYKGSPLSCIMSMYKDWEHLKVCLFQIFPIFSDRSRILLSEDG